MNPNFSANKPVCVSANLTGSSRRASFMNLQRIQYFLALCESFHFTNAARKLGISQPALTKSINQLEKDLGVRLIRREGRHTHLTKQGAVIRDKYMELVAAVGQIEADISSAIVDESKNLKLAVARTIDFSKFIGFLARYHALYPGVRLDITDCNESECEELLLNGEVDFSLTITRCSRDDQVLFIETFTDELGVMATSELSEAEFQSQVSSVKRQLQEGSLDESQCNTSIFNAIEGRAVVSVDQESWARQLIQAGLGVGFVSSNSGNLLESKGVRWEPIEKRSVYVSLIAGRFDSDAYTRFVDLLKNFKWENGSNLVRVDGKKSQIGTKMPSDV